jgi:hypothetical protein
MPRMQNIVVSTTPPVTLVPQSLTNNVGVWRQIVGAFVDRQWLTATIRPAAATNFGQKATFRLSKPHAVDVTDACCVDKTTPLPSSYVTVEFFRHNVATDDDIQLLISELQELVSNADVEAVFAGGGLMG